MKKIRGGVIGLACVGVAFDLIYRFLASFQ